MKGEKKSRRRGEGGGSIVGGMGSGSGSRRGGAAHWGAVTRQKGCYLKLRGHMADREAKRVRLNVRGDVYR